MQNNNLIGKPDSFSFQNMNVVPNFGNQILAPKSMNETRVNFNPFGNQFPNYFNSSIMQNPNQNSKETPMNNFILQPPAPIFNILPPNFNMEPNSQANPPVVVPTSSGSTISVNSLFESANMLTPDDKETITLFLSGNRTNSNPTSGPIRQILLNEDKKN